MSENFISEVAKYDCKPVHRTTQYEFLSDPLVHKKYINKVIRFLFRWQNLAQFYS